MKNSAVKSVSFSQYRAFKEPQSLSVKPLTILFGYNNSGKSSAIRLLSILAASFSQSRPETYAPSFLDYTAPCLRGAIFRNIAFANQSRMSFGIEWCDGDCFSFDIKQEGVDKEVLTSLTYKENSPSGLRESIFIQGLGADGRYVDANNAGRELYLDRFSIVKNLKSKKPLFPSISKKTFALSNSVHWLNAVRIYPPREFTINSSVPVGIRFDGGGTAEAIWDLASKKSKAFDWINEWLAETCGRKIVLDTLSQSVSNDRIVARLETVSVNESDVSSPIRVPILDSGEGIAQALPVVTLCALAATGDLGEYPIILLEQPELHLHPKAIVTLANFLVRCIRKNTNARFVIETHSESLLLAVQTVVASKELNLADVSAYWVSRAVEADGSTLKKVEFDEDAYILNNFPSEVFQEVYEQAKNLIKVRDGEGA
ncbi:MULTISPECIES: AAA family ATPase [Pseudomonas]|uniref:AAA family ATPase n=2 Tax=Pseudomonas TaxID=286 RepID=UPI0002EC3839|nr:MULTISPECIES: ATP-binding protein [Pseudomonas]MCE0755701.1 ATP-binding protein [Pseudomonas asiatica]MCE0944772.1 ATP-binding protein [Pseudomonas asiatica]MCE0956395.1 ATP-binding protein [Pseudomonas asiatica]MCE1031251.1 ATP-binding protein [Pseudomonas asiatica]MCE1065144.1 ATP-binding protein [Pseudomonas asiatica]